MLLFVCSVWFSFLIFYNSLLGAFVLSSTGRLRITMAKKFYKLQCLHFLSNAEWFCLWVEVSFCRHLLHLLKPLLFLRLFSPQLFVFRLRWFCAVFTKPYCYYCITFLLSELFAAVRCLCIWPIFMFITVLLAHLGSTVSLNILYYLWISDIFMMKSSLITSFSHLKLHLSAIILELYRNSLSFRSFSDFVKKMFLSKVIFRDE